MQSASRVIFVAQPHSVPAFFINVQREGNVVFSQGFREHHGVFHRHGLVFKRRPEKTRRRVGGDLKFAGKEFFKFGAGVGANQIVVRTLVRELPHGDDGVTQDAEVGPRALPIDDVSRVGVAGIKMR